MPPPSCGSRESYTHLVQPTAAQPTTTGGCCLSRPRRVSKSRNQSSLRAFRSERRSRQLCRVVNATAAAIAATSSSTPTRAFSAAAVAAAFGILSTRAADSRGRDVWAAFLPQPRLRSSGYFHEHTPDMSSYHDKTSCGRQLQHQLLPTYLVPADEQRLPLHVVLHNHAVELCGTAKRVEGRRQRQTGRQGEIRKGERQDEEAIKKKRDQTKMRRGFGYTSEEGKGKICFLGGGGRTKLLLPSWMIGGHSRSQQHPSGKKIKRLRERIGPVRRANLSIYPCKSSAYRARSYGAGGTSKGPQGCRAKVRNRTKKTCSAT